MMESIPATVMHRYSVSLVRNYCLMLLLGDKLQCGALADMTTEYAVELRTHAAFSEVTNEAQAGAIDNWGAFNCFDHNRLPQVLFSSQLSKGPLPR